MNDGFFTSSQMNKFIKLPPRLQVEFPLTEKEKPKDKPALNSKIPQMVLDIECYSNYFLLKFKRLVDNKLFKFEKTEEQELDYDSIEDIIKDYEVISFNGNAFDIPLLNYALEGATCTELKEAADDLIKSDIAVWQFEKKHKLPEMKNLQHVDLIELLPGIVSLKIYGGRLHCKKMQDLPYPENSILTDRQMDDVDEYNTNDLDLTELIVLNQVEQIELRREMSKKYKIDLMSKSDAQIAEAIIKSEVYKLTKKELEKVPVKSGSFYYTVPKFIQFTNPILNNALDIVTTKPFVLKHGRPTMPEELVDLKVKIGPTIYRMGMGGLHSTEKSMFHISTNNITMWDWDVDSYYPKIIDICGLYPKHIGPEFLTIYRPIVKERLDAKYTKNKDAKTVALIKVYKIVLNGSFGKFGSPYSVLYSPELMVQVTVTGQLCLLMLIDMMEQKGISIVSGNTDGIVIKCPKNKEELMQYIVKRWEQQTGFTMESTRYAGIYSRDVNNYIAIKEDGKAKLKGTFSPAGLAKNPENEICTIAMINYLKYGTPLEQTIKGCTDITKFVTVRQVNGGATKNGKYLGKAIRWYHAKNEAGTINYLTNNNIVPLTEGAKPIMDISIPFPNDIDFDWYETRCREMFK